MKRLEIGRPIVNFARRPLQDPTKEGDDKTIYVRDLLIQAVGNQFKAENKARVILAYKVGQKLFDCPDQFIDLEDAEFELIKSAIEKPLPGLSPLVMGQIYPVIDDAEKERESD